MPRYDLDPIEPPALPIAPTEYNQGERDRFSNVLRLYFNRIASFVRSLIGTAGGRFLDFPNGLFLDNRDYQVGSSDVAAPIRFDTTVYSNGLSIYTEFIQYYDGAPGANILLYASVEDGSGGAGNILFMDVLSNASIAPGMIVNMTGLAAGTYIKRKITNTQFEISTTALLSVRQVTFTGESRIKAEYPGRYNFQFSIQLVNFTNLPYTVSIWWRKNGTDVADSNSEFGLPVRKGSGNPSHVIASMNFFIDLERDDYIQIIWRTQDVDVYIEHFPAVSAGVGTPAIPATPSVILTGNFVSRLVNS